MYTIASKKTYLNLGLMLLIVTLCICFLDIGFEGFGSKEEKSFALRPSNTVAALAYDRSDGALIGAGHDGVVEAINVVHEAQPFVRTVLREFNQASVVVISTNGEKFAYVSSGKAGIFDLRNKKQLWSDDHVTLVGLSPNGKKAAVVYRQSYTAKDALKVFDLSTGIGGNTTLLSRECISALAFSETDRLLAVGTTEGEVTVWDTETQRKVVAAEHQSQISCLAFSHAGTFLAGGSTDGGLRVWDVASGQICFTEGVSFMANFGFTSSMTSILFTPDDRSILTGNTEGSIEFWNMPAGKRSRRFHAHDGSVASMVFTNEGHILYTGGADGLIKSWQGVR